VSFLTVVPEKRRLIRVYHQGLSIFLGGFLVWTLDNTYCQTIRGWRHQIQLPWAVVLEGHAWWHLMTGIGESLTRVA
jgi:hypothetical protein